MRNGLGAAITYLGRSQGILDSVETVVWCYDELYCVDMTYRDEYLEGDIPGSYVWILLGGLYLGGFLAYPTAVLDDILRDICSILARSTAPLHIFKPDRLFSGIEVDVKHQFCVGGPSNRRCLYEESWCWSKDHEQSWNIEFDGYGDRYQLRTEGPLLLDDPFMALKNVLRRALRDIVMKQSEREVDQMLERLREVDEDELLTQPWYHEMPSGWWKCR